MPYIHFIWELAVPLSHVHDGAPNIYIHINTLTHSNIYAFMYTQQAIKNNIMRHVIVGRGGTLVETTHFDRRVADSNPVLAATKGPWASPSLTVACSASACKLRHSVKLSIAVVGNTSEGFKRYSNGWYNTIQPTTDMVNMKPSVM